MYPKHTELLTKTPFTLPLEKKKEKSEERRAFLHDTMNRSTAQYIAGCLGVWLDNQQSISRWELLQWQKG